VALKKCFEAFANATDAQRTYREIMLLYALAGHDNIVHIQEVLRSDNDKDIYVTVTFMDSDLHVAIRAGVLERVHMRYIIYQLCKALKYIHSGCVIHRDLKPSNVLLNTNCHVRLCDFGLARSVGVDGEAIQAGPVLTDYVATRWYRAPEILMGSAKYTRGVDIWSLGCILGEISFGKPLLPGTSTMNQLERIVAVTGRPDKEDIERLQSPFASTMLESVSLKPQTLLSDIFNKEDDVTEFVHNCLAFSPAKRMAAKDLLETRLLQQFRQSENEPECAQVIDIGVDDNKRLKIQEYRERLYLQMHQRKREQQRQSQAPSIPSTPSSCVGDD